MPNALPFSVRQGYVFVNDIYLHYIIYGEGVPVLLLHGGLGSSDWWGNQIAELQKSHQVIAIDSRGNGRSTRTSETFSYELMMSDTLLALEHLHIENVYIVGWSDGAIIGLLLATHHPEKIKGLFAFGVNSSLSGLKNGFEHSPTFVEAFKRAEHEYKKLSQTPDEFSLFVQQISVLWTHDPNLSDSLLKTIIVPITIAIGSHDEAILHSHTRHIADLIPKAKLVIFPNASHFAPLQIPLEFNRELLRALEEL
jgi:pimeloyl-ACP methyl ester carboxylesterase